MDKQKLIYNIIKILEENNLNRKKIHIQKFISFLSYRIDNIPFSFSIDKYGPFSSELRDDLHSMVLWGDLSYINDQYETKNDSSSINQQLYQQIETEIRQYANIIGELSFDNMLIYGTLFYILNNTCDRDKDNIIQLFHNTVNTTFTDEQLAEPLDKLLKTYFNNIVGYRDEKTGHYILPANWDDKEDYTEYLKRK